MFNGRAENGNHEGLGGLDQIRRRGNDDFAGDRVCLSLNQHRDRAIVVFLARVVVNHFVQRGARGHRVQQQDDAHQQGGQGRFANREKMFLHVLQIVCNLAGDVPLASHFDNTVVTARRRCQTIFQGVPLVGWTA